jgi:hypothetical protein
MRRKRLAYLDPGIGSANPYFSLALLSLAFSHGNRVKRRGDEQRRGL